VDNVHAYFLNIEVSPRFLMRTGLTCSGIQILFI